MFTESIEHADPSLFLGHDAEIRSRITGMKNTMRDRQLNWAMKAVPERYKKSHIISIANVPRSRSLSLFPAPPPPATLVVSPPIILVIFLAGGIRLTLNRLCCRYQKMLARPRFYGVLHPNEHIN